MSRLQAALIINSTRVSSLAASRRVAFPSKRSVRHGLPGGVLGDEIALGIARFRRSSIHLVGSDRSIGLTIARTASVMNEPTEPGFDDGALPCEVIGAIAR